MSTSLVESVIGSTGVDTLTLLMPSAVTTSLVESVIGTTGSDTLVLAPTGMVSVSQVESVVGSAIWDTLFMMTDGTIYVANAVETIIGSAGVDTVYVLDGSEVWTAGVESVEYPSTYKLNGVQTQISLSYGDYLPNSTSGDTIELVSASAVHISAAATILGSAGIDIVTLRTSGTRVVSGVDSLISAAGATDTMVLLSSNAMAVSSIDSILSVAGVTDTVALLTSGSTLAGGIDSLISIPGATDTLSLLNSNSLAISGVESVISPSGATDTLTLLTSGVAVFFDVDSIISARGATDTVTLLTSQILAVSGVDTLTGTNSTDTVYLLTSSLLATSNIDRIYSNSGVTDTVTLLTGTIVMLSSVDSLISGGGATDTVVLLTSASLSAASVDTIVSRFGATDTVTLLSSRASFYFSVDSIISPNGIVDTINLLTSSSVIVSGVDSVLSHSGVTDTIGLLTSNKITVSSIDSIIGTLSTTDTVVMLTSASMVVNSIDTVVGSAGTDTLTLMTNGIIYVTNIESVVGSSGVDTVIITPGAGVPTLVDIESLVTFTPDTTAPSAPAGLDLAAADDTGTSNSDNITSQTSALTISGTGEVGASLVLFDDKDNDGVIDSGEALTTTSLTAATWSADISLASGSHAIKAVQTDVAGNSSTASTALSVTIGQIYTVISINNFNGHTYKLVHTSEDISWTDAKNQAEAMGGYLATITSSEENKFISSLYNDSSSYYWLGGYQPNPGVGEPNGGWAWVTGESWSYTNWYSGPHSQPDNDGGTEHFLQAVGPSIGFYSSVWGQNSDGYLWNDVSNNSSVKNFILEIGSAFPYVPVSLDLAAADDTGTSNSDNITKNTSALTISGGGGMAGNKLVLFDDKDNDGVIDSGEALVTTSLTAATWSADISLASGTHAIKAVQTDAAGNSSTVSAALTFTLDYTVPTAPTSLDLAAADDSGASDSDNITKNTNALTINGSGGEVGGSLVLFDDKNSNSWVDGGEVLVTTTITAAAWSADISLANGTHSIKAIQTDVAGNSSEASSALAITVQSAVSSPLSFATTVNYAVGGGPRGITSADFNGDGRIDIACATEFDHNVSVLLGQVSGSFAAAVNYAVDSYSLSVTSADFNGDGRIDIVSANRGSASISVLLGQASGGFAAAVNYGVGSQPQSVASADVNGDGRVDIVSANFDSNNVSVLLGQAAGGFAAAANYAVGNNPWGVTSADFNGDGRVDIASTNFNSNDVSVLLSQASGGFAAAANYAVGSSPISVTSADINSDGYLDIVSANWGGGVSVLLGQASGGFAQAVNYAVGGNPCGVTSADINGDGFLDIISANWGSSDVSVLLGQASGGFATAVNYAVGSGPASVTSADFNSDGLLDIVSANVNANSVSVLLSTTSGGFAPPQPTNLDLAAADDTGTSNSDNITSQTSALTISGTGEVGASLVLFNDKDNDGVIDGSEALVTTRLTAAAWSTDISLANGTHAIKAIQTDVAGNSSTASTALSVTVDTTAPSQLGAASTYNALADFSTTSSNTGIWRYGEGKTGNSFLPLGNYNSDSANIYWSSSQGWVDSGLPAVAKKIIAGSGGFFSEWTTNVANNTPGGLLVVHPAGNSTRSDVIIKWVAPATATYNVSSIFALDGGSYTGGVDALIFSNSTQLVQQHVGPRGTFTFEQSLDLQVGDVLLFGVNDAGWGNGDATGFNATITTVNNFLDLAATDDTGASNSDNITSQTSALTISGTGEVGASLVLFDDKDNDGVIDSGEALAITNLTAAAWSADISLTAGTHAIKAIQTDAAGNVSAASAASLQIVVADAFQVSLNASMAFTPGESVLGTDGTDTVIVMNNGSGAMNISGVETVLGASGIETVTLLSSGKSVVSSIDTLISNAGVTDTVALLTGHHVIISNIESLMSVAGATDTVVMLTGGRLTVSQVDSIIGSSANETVTLLTSSKTVVSGVDSLISVSNATDTVTLLTSSAVMTSGINSLIGTTYSADTMTLLTSSVIAVSNIDTLFSANGATDTVTLLTAGVVRMSEVDSLLGSTGADTVALLTGGVIYVTNVENIIGSNGADTVVVLGSSPITALNVESVLYAGIALPTTPTSLDLADVDDSGGDNFDNITKNSNALTISGSGGVSGNKLVLFNDKNNDSVIDNGEALVTTSLTAAAWSADINLAAGTHTIRAIQRNAAGNMSAVSAALTVTVDTTAPATPTVALTNDTGSSANDKISRTGVVTVTGTESSATVQYSTNGSNWSGSFTATTGSNTVYVRQIDTAGNSSVSSTALVFTLDNTAPVAPASLDLATADDSGTSNSDNVTTQTSALTISGSDGEVGTTLVLFDDRNNDGIIDSGEALATTSITGATWSADIALAAGSHAIKAVQTDMAGNGSVASTALTIVVATGGVQSAQFPIQRVSVASDGTQSNGSSYNPILSTDGLFVAFTSDANNLVYGDSNGAPDVFVYDLSLKQTRLVSDGYPRDPSMSADGRLVAFYSDASDLVSGDTNGAVDAFVSDRSTGITVRVSVASDGTQGNGHSGTYSGEDSRTHGSSPSISADGRFVAFSSHASNLVPGDTNFGSDIFVYDRATSTTSRVNISSKGAQSFGGSYNPSISDDGRFVAFASGDYIWDPGLVSGDSNGYADIFVYDRSLYKISRVSTASNGFQSNGHSHELSISGDGRFVAFASSASNLVSDDTNGTTDIFIVSTTTIPIPLALDLAAADDNDISNSDNITFQTSALTISGSGGMAGNKLVLFDDANDNSTIDSDEALATTSLIAATWSADISLVAGTHAIRAIQTDVIGNMSAASSALTVVVQSTNKAPTVSNLSKNGDEDSTITFTTTNFSDKFSDPDSNTLNKIKITSLPSNGTLRLSGAAVTLNQEIVAANLGSLSYAPNSNWSGSDSFGWNGYDGTVYANSAATVTIAVNPVNDAPTVTGFSKNGLSNSALAFTSSDFTDQYSDIEGSGLTKIKITGLPDSGTLQLSSSAVKLDQEITAGNLGNLKLVPVASADSSPSFQWQAFDGSKWSSNAATVNLNFVYSPLSTPTNLALLPSDDSGVVGDGVTNKSSLTVTGSGESGAKVALFDGSSSKGTATITAAGDWSIKLSGLSQGAHTLTAKQLIDGEWSEASPALSVSIDTTAPAAPSNLRYSSSTNEVSGRGESWAILTLFNDSNANGRADEGEVVSEEGLTVNEVGIWSVGIDLPDGKYSFKAIQSDLAGNVSKSLVTLPVTIGSGTITPRPTDLALLPSDDSGFIGDGVTNKTSLTVTGSGESGAKVALFDGSSSKGTATVAAAGDWSVKLSGLSQGAHTLTAKQLVDGEWSEASPELNVIVDSSAPAAPSGLRYSSSSNEVSGKGEAGASLTLFKDGEVFGESIIVDETGNWSSSVALEVGRYNFKATQSDLAGNVSKVSTTLPVTIGSGTTTPTPTDLALLASDDSGVVGDGLTNKSKLTITGSGERGAKVLLFDGDGSKGSATVGATGNWGVSVTGLSQGSHAFTAQQVIDGVNSDLSSVLVIDVDSSAPPAPTGLDLAASSDGGPSDGDNITNVTENLAISGRGEAGSAVILFVDKNKNSKLDSGEIRASGAIVVDEEGNWSGVLATLADGTHTVVASQSDVAGNVSKASAALMITIDTVAPATPTKLDLAAEDDSGSNKSDNITTRTSDLTFSGSGEKGLRVYLFEGEATGIDGALATATVASSGQWTADIAELAVGKHAIRAVQSDLAGNLSPASTALELEIIESVPPPPPTALSLLAGDDSGVVGDGITNKSKGLTFTGDSVAGAKVTLLTEGSAIGSTTANAAGKWSVKLASLAAGAHSFNAQQTTDTGTSGDSEPLTVTIDTSVPTTPTGLQVDGNFSTTPILASGADITIIGSGEDGMTLLLFDDSNKDSKINSGELLATTSIESATWATSVNLFGGSHAIKAIQTNVAGSSSKVSAALAIVVQTPGGFDLANDDDTGPSKIDNITSKSSGLTLSGSAAGAKFVTLFIDGDHFATAAVSRGLWNTDLSLSGGSYSITASQTDSRGNESSPSIPFSLIIDGEAPAAPTDLMIADQEVADSYISNKTAGLVVLGRGEPGASVTLLENKATLGTANVDGEGNWRLTLTKIGNGNHTLTAKQSDVAGNISPLAEQLRVSIDSVAPAAPNGLKFSGSTHIISGNGEAAAVLTLFKDVDNNGRFDPESVDLLVGSDRVATNGKWSIDVAALAIGRHTNLRAIQADAAGNVSKASSALSDITIAAGRLSYTLQSYSGITPVESVFTAGLAFS
ncbi:MAG: VCBS repeat-containing protein [Magnetococcales bacterium]|nr:VCBS repeat-containing protein [Magnetococcales bacterium]